MTKVVIKCIIQNSNVLVNKMHNANIQHELVCAGRRVSKRVMISDNLPK